MTIKYPLLFSALVTAFSVHAADIKHTQDLRYTGSYAGAYFGSYNGVEGQVGLGNGAITASIDDQAWAVGGKYVAADAIVLEAGYAKFYNHEFKDFFDMSAMVFGGSYVFDMPFGALDVGYNYTKVATRSDLNGFPGFDTTAHVIRGGALFYLVRDFYYRVDAGFATSGDSGFLVDNKVGWTNSMLDVYLAADYNSEGKLDIQTGNYSSEITFGIGAAYHF